MRKFIEILKDARIINDSNRSKWLMESGLLTEEGKLILEGMLLATLVPDASLIQTAKIYSNKLLRNIPLLLKVKTFPAGWNFLPELSEVIKFEHNRRTAGVKKDTYIRQISAFHREPTEQEIVLWNLLDKKEGEFRSALQKYIKQAESQISNENAMIKIEKISPKQAQKIHLSDKNPRKQKKETMKDLFLNDPIVKFVRSIFT